MYKLLLYDYAFSKYQLYTATSNSLSGFEMLPEGTEVIDNAIYVRPMPSIGHQDILGYISAAFFMHIKPLKLGKCLAALMDVY